MAAETATDALYQALSSPEPDPQVVHAAIEEIRYLSGHSVIAAIEAKIDSQSARGDVKFSDPRGSGRGPDITEVRAEMKAGFTEVKAEIKAQNSRIDVLQRVLRASWSCILQPRPSRRSIKAS